MSKPLEIPNHHNQRWHGTWAAAFEQGKTHGYAVGRHDGEMDAFDLVWQLVLHHLRTDPEKRWTCENGEPIEVPQAELRFYALANSISKAMADSRDAQVRKFAKAMMHIAKEDTNA